MSPVDIARVCHEVNRKYCQALGDNSHAPWEEAPTWQRESLLKGVIAKIKNPSMTPEDQHINWLKEKAADGWIWGEKKEIKQIEVEIDGKKEIRTVKTHPCYLPYAELPPEQRAKDAIFGAIVIALMDH